MRGLRIQNQSAMSWLFYLILTMARKHTQSACIVVRQVGSFSDPADLPGLAHFLEHMLFYSSTKYPEEDAYSKFLAEVRGKMDLHPPFIRRISNFMIKNTVHSNKHSAMFLKSRSLLNF